MVLDLMKHNEYDKNAQLKFQPNKHAMAEYDTYAKDDNLMF